MSERRLLIGQLAMTAVDDMVAAVGAAPGLFAFLLLGAAGVAYLEEAAPQALGLPDLAQAVLVLAVSSLVGAAVAVTMHRFIILDETNTVASLAARWRILLDFTAVLFGAQYLVMLPALLASSIWGRQEDMPDWVVGGSVVVLVAGFLAILRYLLVFPAVAIDAEDRSLKGAAAGVGRVILPIVFAYVVAMLIISLVGLLVGLLLLAFGLSELPIVMSFVRLLFGLAASAAAVAVVSRAYMWRDGRWPADQA